LYDFDRTIENLSLNYIMFKISNSETLGYCLQITKPMPDLIIRSIFDHTASMVKFGCTICYLF